jgi:hypothetical protein
MRTNRFTLTEDHIKLLSAMYVSWEYGGDYSMGVPIIDPKRPYGNTNVEMDIAEELEWELFETSDGETVLSKEQGELARKLHTETETALQIVLATRSFEPGIYEKAETYDVHSWRRV